MNLTFQRMEAFFLAVIEVFVLQGLSSFILGDGGIVCLGFFNTKLIASYKWHLLTSGQTFRSTALIVSGIVGKNNASSSSFENNKIESFSFSLVGTEPFWKSVRGGTSAKLVYCPLSSLIRSFLEWGAKSGWKQGGREKNSLLCMHTHTRDGDTG